MSRAALATLLSPVATVLMCASRFRSKIGCEINMDRDGFLQSAKLYLLKRCQIKYFTKEYGFINGDQIHTPYLVKQLRLYLDENKLIRCKGRLQFAHYVREFGDPILLPHASHLTKLIILQTHLRMHSTLPIGD